MTDNRVIQHDYGQADAATAEADVRHPDNDRRAGMNDGSIAAEKAAAIGSEGVDGSAVRPARLAANLSQQVAGARWT